MTTFLAAVAATGTAAIAVVTYLSYRHTVRSRTQDSEREDAERFEQAARLRVVPYEDGRFTVTLHNASDDAVNSVRLVRVDCPDHPEFAGRFDPNPRFGGTDRCATLAKGEPFRVPFALYDEHDQWVDPARAGRVEGVFEFVDRRGQMWQLTGEQPPVAV